MVITGKQYPHHIVNGKQKKKFDKQEGILNAIIIVITTRATTTTNYS